MTPVRVFVSYAWEDDEYRSWVRRLAGTLRRDGVDARIDAWHRQTGQDFASFMNAEVRNADRVLVLGSPDYRRKVHAFEEGRSTSGVGWEAMLLTAQMFAGNREKIAVGVTRGSRNAALPDFLQTQFAHDLSTPEDPRGYRELVEDLRGEKPTAPPLGRPDRFDSEEETPLFETPTGLQLTVELRRWIDARWPESKPGASYPPWSEFEAGKVTFPDVVTTSVAASFDRSPRALIVGTSASGKSVLGASVAFRWSRVTGRRAFWLDLGDQIGLSRDAIHRDVMTFLGLSGGNLLVLDNAQVAPAVADWAVNQVEAADQMGARQHRLLILTRPLQAPERHHAGLEERLASERTTLIPNAALFASVAERLLSRLEVTQKWTPADYERWVHEFGGDLVCFGQAVLGAGGTRRPTRSMAVTRVRQAYIDPAGKHDQGFVILDRLCAASVLDLTIDDSALDGRVSQALPHLVEAGQVQELQRGDFRHWKLAHPGLGSLILETRARDLRREEADVRRTALLELVRNSPFMLGPVMIRLANPNYGGAREVECFSRLLQTQPAIVEAFLCRAPAYAVEVDRRVPHLIPWSILRDSRPRESILATCRRAPPNDVVTFLRYAEHHEREAVLGLLRALLADADFRALLGRAPPHLVVTFLRYAEHREREAVLALLRALLADADFRGLLGRAPPGDVVTFLRYAEHHEREAVLGLLRALLADADFRALLGRAPPGYVVTFLRYAEHHEREAVLALLRALLADADFRALLGRAPPGDVVAFLRYAEHHEREAVLALLRALLANADFRALLGRTSVEQVASFLEYAKGRELGPATSLLRALLSTPEFARTAAATPAGHLARFTLFALERVGADASPWLDTVLGLPAAHHLVCAATPTDLTALVRAVRSPSVSSGEELATRLLRDWWSAFRGSSSRDGNELVGCGPILRLAHELAPDVADELVSWLNALNNQFVDAIRPIPLISRLGLALALRDTERWLAPPLWEALSQQD